MPHYNLALVPNNPELAKELTEFATKHFGALADTYLLGKEALPHITLCKFESPFGRLSEIWFATRHNFPTITPVMFSGLRFRHGRDLAEGFAWAEFTVERTNEIIAGQRRILAGLAERQFTTHSLAGDNYHPHLTLARLKPTAKLPACNWMNEDFWQTPHSFEISVALSDEIGVYHQRLF